MQETADQSGTFSESLPENVLLGSPPRLEAQPGQLFGQSVLVPVRKHRGEFSVLMETRPVAAPELLAVLWHHRGIVHSVLEQPTRAPSEQELWRSHNAPSVLP